MNAIELLDDFKRRRSDESFRELVRRYTNLVYSAAKRRLDSEMLAQDAAQAVFIRLAKAPPSLTREVELTGWLHRTTLHVSIDLWRSEVRRRAREEHAVAMQTIPDEDRSWVEIVPSLDQALDELNDADREVILLRFFNHKSMRELGDTLGISEDAAKMRVSRAVSRLREQLGATGVACSAAGVGAFLAQRAVEAAPAAVAAAIASFNYPLGSAAAGLAAGATSVGTGLSLAKIAVGLAGLALIALTVWTTQRSPRTREVTEGRPVDSASQAAPAAIAGAELKEKSGLNAAETQPDPVKLLEAVARARQRLASGQIEFQIDTFGATFHTTNRLRVTALFEGGRQHFEQIGREYSYTYDPDPARAEEIQKKAEAFGFDKEGAIRAGLLSGFEARYTTIYDGESLMQYRQKNGEPEGATVDDPAKGSSVFVFDPRSLGLSPSLSVRATVEGCLGGEDMRSAQLIGRESVEGLPAWHVRVPGTYPRDIWLDVADPLRVLKHDDGFAVSVAKYDATARNDPIPKEVVITRGRNGGRDSETRLVQLNSQFNITVEPATFTLEGLGMKVGTSVSDVRNHRQIGYWTGSGLSADLPPRNAQAPPATSTIEEMQAILDTFDPASDEAFDAAQWILLNTPDGPVVDCAARVVLENHSRRPNLASFCQRIQRIRHRCSGELLAAILKDNPQPETQAVACFALATLRKDQSKFGEDKKLAAEAEALFEKVIAQFGQVGANAADRSWKATQALSELRRMSIGSPAPDFEGVDLEGHPVKLSAQRGKVTAVVFWYASNIPAPEESLMILNRFAGKPFVCVSVYCDDDRERARPVLEKYPPPGPVIWDGNHGPIAAAWQIPGWPSSYILDRNGVIRGRDVRGRELVDLVTRLLEE